MERISAAHALTPNGWEQNITIAIEGGRIASVERLEASPARFVDLLLPAPVNLHSHAFQRAMSALAEARETEIGESFWTWRRTLYHFLDKLVPNQVEAIAALAFMEMLEAGYGAVVEFHYLHHGLGGAPYDDPAEMAAHIVAAAQAAGIGLTLLPVLYMHGGCDYRPLSGVQQRFGNNMESFARLHDASRRHIRHAYPDYAIGVAPHSLRAVDPGSLNDVTTLASKDEIIHIHLAEQEAEIRETLAHLGARPVEWLLQHQDIGPRWCCVHCTQMTAQETQALAASGAVAGLCPITEANLGDGIFNAVEFAAAGGRFGIGSDSNVHITLFEELCLLEYSQRLRDHSRAALAQAGRSTGRVLYETALAGGAQAAARDSGSISPGAVADLVALTSDNEWLCGRVGDPALDSLIFSGRGRNCVRDVWSAGRHVVKEGRHVARDRIVGNFIRVMQTLSQDFPL